MDSINIRFLTYLIKPWDELNILLSQRFAFQPEISDVTRLAANLAVAIKHQADGVSISRKVVDVESQENNLMSDVADVFKHVIVRDASRNNQLLVSSQFECNSENQFRFIRNIVTIDHASAGKVDFMLTSKQAIHYWIQRLNLPINWKPLIEEGSPEFHEYAFLYFNPRYQVNMESLNLKTFKKQNDGVLAPYAPPEVKFAIYEYKEPTT